ncbi:uncharacterized protein F5147DRAFT_674036 [Suillus discolor]|uniref:C2H2-type domain-containing protein n=1 Tax=Suillus discolor TaxID=1912936 RepID=A0A9P7JYC7_9AGAM|nr:uncharacterized protein F5147DRAFT_674036 [Suillus discolor]KAG2116704.1 hypothetical protein F5147DRAFT_674036 [Suillus discolor]
MPAAGRNTTPVNCPVCHKAISRKADLPRHMRTHDEHKEALMHACPFPNCDYKTLQKSNLQTHIRTHTRERSNTCPHSGCAFSTTDPGSLTRHRKQLHGYEPKARRSPGGKAARRTAAAPYPSTRFMKPEIEIPASLDLNHLTFPELAGLVPCDALSPAESSDSGILQSSGELTELPWERLFPDLPAESFASIYEQPIPTFNYFRPSTVPVDLSTLHMPQFDPELFSDVNYQQPVPNVNFQSQPGSGKHLNNPLPVELDEFLQKYGSGYFEDPYAYSDNTMYSMAQPSFTNEYL